LKELEKIEGTASRADTIAHRTKKTIEERMDEDPAFYRKFSEMLEEAIRAFRERRLADRDYLARVSEIADSIRNRGDDGLPSALRHHDGAKAFYGVIAEVASAHSVDHDFREALAQTALRVDEIIQRER